MELKKHKKTIVMVVALLLAVSASLGLDLKESICGEAVAPAPTATAEASPAVTEAAPAPPAATVALPPVTAPTAAGGAP